jgi:hypothetical protein
MFDAMTVVEAEKFLPVPADQYAAFVVKLKRLQEARAAATRQRNRVVAELRGLVGPQARADVPDSLIDAKLKELAKIEADSSAAVRQAMDDLDAVLSPRQRARFRLLEENLDRKKLDMLTKVRQPGGPGPFPGPGGMEGAPLR